MPTTENKFDPRKMDNDWIIRESGDDVDILPHFCSPHGDAIAAVFGETREQQVNRAKVMRAAPVLKDILENVVIAFGMGWDMEQIVDVAKQHLETIQLLEEAELPPVEYQLWNNDTVLITMPTFESAGQWASDNKSFMPDKIVKIHAGETEELESWAIHWKPQIEMGK